MDKNLTTFKVMGFQAFRSGEVRVAPVIFLLAQAGIPAVDAWYIGFDEARGFGPMLTATPVAAWEPSMV